VAITDPPLDVPDKRVRVDVYHHFPDPLDVKLSGRMTVLVGGAPAGIKVVPGIPKTNTPP
jgi:hypothetical protein